MSLSGEMSATLEEAMALHQQGDTARAETLYHDVLEKVPDEPNALHLLGALDWQRNDLASAEDKIRRAIKKRGDVAAFHLNLGGVLRQKGALDESIAEYSEALRLAPGDETSRRELARTLHRHGSELMGRHAIEPAKEMFRRVLDFEPNNVATLNNLAMITQHEGDRTAARQLYDRALKQTSENLPLLYNRATNFLTQAKLEEGWADLAASERHWRTCMDPRKDLPWLHLPLWDGGEVRGKKILIWGDLGIGDEILFAGMIPDLIERGAQVSLECNPRLVPLFARSFPEAKIYARQDPPSPELNVDVQCPGLWLTRWLRPSLGHFNARPSYLKPDPQKVRQLKTRYRGVGRKKIVGLAWYTSSPPWGRLRSVPLPDMLGALDLTDIVIIDLQYGVTTDAWNKARAMYPALDVIQDPEIDQLKNMDDFAAQVAACDFVFTIGNTTAHVAGSLGVPSAVLLPTAGLTWYWFESGEKCPWYPSLTLLRPQDAGRLQRAAAMIEDVVDQPV